MRYLITENKLSFREKRISKRRGSAQCCYCINFTLTEKTIKNNWGTAKGYCGHIMMREKGFDGMSIVMRRKCKYFQKHGDKTI